MKKKTSEKANLRVRVPTPPEQMLEEKFLTPLDITQQSLAESIHLPLSLIEDIVSGGSGITPSAALRLAKYFGNSADFWMSLQLR